VGIINRGRKKDKREIFWNSNAKHKNGLKQIKVQQVDHLSAWQGHKKPREPRLKERFEFNFQTNNKARLHDLKQ
jgi:RecA-family ATPase